MPLGYHAKSDEKSLESYSRDSMAGPLRVLVEVVADVRCGRFDPDATRSGQIVATPPAPAADDDSSGSSAGPVSESSADPEASEIEVPRELLVQDVYIKNTSSGEIHVMKSDGSLTCDLAVPARYSVLRDLPLGAKLCTKCF